MSSIRGKLYVVSGPSGAGKGTIVRALMETEPRIALSVSATTRPPRDDERDGEHYHFIAESEFLQMIDSSALLEHNHHFGAYYGTPRAHVEQRLADGYDVILEIEVMGGAQVKAKVPDDTVMVFVLPPDMKELERRLRGRDSESEEKIAARLARAAEELEAITRYDYIIVNETVPQAAADLQSIIRAERLKTSRCSHILEQY